MLSGNDGVLQKLLDIARRMKNDCFFILFSVSTISSIFIQ